MWLCLRKTVSFTFICSIRTATKECLCNWTPVVCRLDATQSDLYLLDFYHCKIKELKHTRHYIFHFILKDRCDQADYCHDRFYCCTCLVHFTQCSADLMHSRPIRQLTWSLHESEICHLNCCHPNYHAFETHYWCLKYALQSMKSNYELNSVFKISLFKYVEDTKIA